MPFSPINLNEISTPDFGSRSGLSIWVTKPVRRPTKKHWPEGQWLVSEDFENFTAINRLSAPANVDPIVSKLVFYPKQVVLALGMLSQCFPRNISERKIVERVRANINQRVRRSRTRDSNAMQIAARQKC